MRYCPVTTWPFPHTGDREGKRNMIHVNIIFQYYGTFKNIRNVWHHRPIKVLIQDNVRAHFSSQPLQASYWPSFSIGASFKRGENSDERNQPSPLLPLAFLFLSGRSQVFLDLCTSVWSLWQFPRDHRIHLIPSLRSEAVSSIGFPGLSLSLALKLA